MYCYFLAALVATDSRVHLNISHRTSGLFTWRLSCHVVYTGPFASHRQWLEAKCAPGEMASGVPLLLVSPPGHQDLIQNDRSFQAFQPKSDLLSLHPHTPTYTDTNTHTQDLVIQPINQSTSSWLHPFMSFINSSLSDEASGSQQTRIAT